MFRAFPNFSCSTGKAKMKIAMLSKKSNNISRTDMIKILTFMNFNLPTKG